MRQSPLLRFLNPPLARLHSALRYPRTPDFPTSFVIETTSRCNLNCRMCPRRDMRRPAQDMSPELFGRLIEQMAEHEERFLALHWFGEPLLHPQILDFIALAGERLPYLLSFGRERNAVRGLTLSTNATLLDEDAARGLLASPLTWLGVSVDGSSPETYESLRCGGAFEQVMANVQRLLEMNAASDRELPTIALQVIATEATIPEFAAAVERWQALAQGRANVRVELKPWTDWAGQVVAPELVAPDTRPGFLYLDCGRLHDTLVIGAGGEIGLCCYDVQADFGLGNAAEQTIAEIWRGEKLQALRRKMRWGRLAGLPLCRDCAMGRKYPLDMLRRVGRGR
ncbi:MAG: radical SAM protein [Armatimonadetes bacterium]|nr:radical SAM protein [Armatimonadota bacterium]